MPPSFSQSKNTPFQILWGALTQPRPSPTEYYPCGALLTLNKTYKILTNCNYVRFGKIRLIIN